MVRPRARLRQTPGGDGDAERPYDAAGNEVQLGATTFIYSPRNYLDQGDGLRYLYDGSFLVELRSLLDNIVNYTGSAGVTVIHEWARGCGFDPDKWLEGIPGSEPQ